MNKKLPNSKFQIPNFNFVIRQLFGKWKMENGTLSKRHPRLLLALLFTITIAVVGHTSFMPTLTYAQFAKFEVQYELQPNATDTPFTNRATMTVSGEGGFSASACTEIGDVKDNKCVGSGILAGWPTSGTITQGPLGQPTHANIYNASRVLGRNFESVDIANIFDTPVYATFDGVVKVISRCARDGCPTGYGNYVEIANKEGTFSVMHGHFSSISVNQGQSVTRGTEVGLIGTTGNSSGPHLHWEFRDIPLAPPNIPEPITPRNCPAGGVCQPPLERIKFDPNLSPDSGNNGRNSSPF